MLKIWISILSIFGILLGGCTSTSSPQNSTATRQLLASSTPTGIGPTETLISPTTTPVPTTLADTAVPTANLLPTSQPEQTQPAGNGLIQNDVYLDKVELVMSGSHPAQPTIRLQGTLPTPCNKLQVDVGKPDSSNKIQVQVYSQIDPTQMCAQVLVPFTQDVPIKNLSSGSYSVWVNGKQAGKIDVP
jgi:hypothetical protein